MTNTTITAINPTPIMAPTIIPATIPVLLGLDPGGLRFTAPLVVVDPGTLSDDVIAHVTPVSDEPSVVVICVVGGSVGQTTLQPPGLHGKQVCKVSLNSL